MTIESFKRHVKLELTRCQRNLDRGGSPRFWLWRLLPVLVDLDEMVKLVRRRVGQLDKLDRESCGGRAQPDKETFVMTEDAVAEHARLLRLIEDTARENDAMRDAARTVVAEMRGEHVMKSYDAGRCVAAERVDDQLGGLLNLIEKRRAARVRGF